jgi:formate hydrogenlyase transcriptional activator
MLGLLPHLFRVRAGVRLDYFAWLGFVALWSHENTSRACECLAWISWIRVLLRTSWARKLTPSLDYQQIMESRERLLEQGRYLEEEIRTEHNFEEIVGESRSLLAALRQVETVAPTNSTVLIHGETGTGKELIARAIHNLSSRRDHMFVRLNCAAIPLGLLESELFGHEKGAFTGAIAQKVGRFELANKSTLFLDEIGDIPLELQSKLLRVLQEQEFERLGSNRTLRVDVRLVAATNRDLAQMVVEKAFRSDLYYRLNVFPVSLPLLRERPDDIPLLVRHFTSKYSREMNRRIESIPDDVMEALVSYSWPGNVRELQNFIERAVILSPARVLRPPLAELRRGEAAPVCAMQNATTSSMLFAPLIGRLAATTALPPASASNAPLWCTKCGGSASPFRVRRCDQ